MMKVEIFNQSCELCEVESLDSEALGSTKGALCQVFGGEINDLFGEVGDCSVYCSGKVIIDAFTVLSRSLFIGA